MIGKKNDGSESQGNPVETVKAIVAVVAAIALFAVFIYFAFFHDKNKPEEEVKKTTVTQPTEPISSVLTQQTSSSSQTPSVETTTETGSSTKKIESKESTITTRRTVPPKYANPEGTIFNPSEKNKKYWPTNVYKKRMDEVANEFATRAVGPKLKNDKSFRRVLHMLEHYKAKDKLRQDREFYSQFVPTGAKLVKAGYADAIYKIQLTEETAKPYRIGVHMYEPDFTFAIKMNPVDKNDWRITQFYPDIVEKSF